MFKIAATLVVLSLSSLSIAQKPPSIADQVSTNMVETIYTQGQVLELVGTLYADWSLNLVRFDYSSVGGTATQFQNYSSHIAYAVNLDKNFNPTCTKSPITWPVGSKNALEQSTFTGKCEYAGQECDCWKYTDSVYNSELFFYFDQTSRLVGNSVTSTALNYTIIYFESVPSVADPSMLYPPPSICM